MIRSPRPAAPAMRLVAAAGGLPAGTIVLSSAETSDLRSVGARLGDWSREATRVLVLGALGTHRDARRERLRRLWHLEELARSSGLPVLVLRLGPLVGPASPLWLRLRSAPRLPRGGMQMLNPVAEDDAVLTMRRALAGEVEWAGWYEVAGREVLLLRELAALALRADRLPRGSGAWEPPVEEMEEHRLTDGEPWRSVFAIPERPLAERAAEWS